MTLVEKTKLELNMDSPRQRTVKSRLAKVFIGDPEHAARLQDVLIRMQRLRIHTTHFLKWYLEHVPDAQQKTLNADNVK